MDCRTSYRVKFRPDAGNRWIAQYRVWWSPFWLTYSRVDDEPGWDAAPQLTFPVWFDTQTAAESWCREDADQEIEARRKRAAHRANRLTVYLGRLP